MKGDSERILLWTSVVQLDRGVNLQPNSGGCAYVYDSLEAEVTGVTSEGECSLFTGIHAPA